MRALASVLLACVAVVSLLGCRDVRADLLGTPTASPSGSPVPVTTAAPTFRYFVDSESSLVTVRVREQLAGLTSPSDAVLSTSAVKGVIGLTRDGRVADITDLRLDLSRLESDEPRRDSFIKQETLATQQFPEASLKVTGTFGLPSPLPPNGEWRVTLLTVVTVRGTAHDVRWDLTATRVGRELRATARTTVKFGDFGLRRPSVAAVLSVTDEIRVEVLLRAVLG